MRRSAGVQAILALLIIFNFVNAADDESCAGLSIDDCTSPLHEDCTTCKLNVGFAKVDFCISKAIADQLPAQMFTCADDPPAPEPPLPSPPAPEQKPYRQDDAASVLSTDAIAIDSLTSDECSDLGKGACEGNPSCSWCVSAAVPSACYTIEQARRLPAAVFACELPSAQF